MARNDIKIVSPTSLTFAIKWLKAAGAQGTSGGGGYMGEPFMSQLATAAQTGLVMVCADGDGTISTGATADGRFVGIAKTDSTQTAAVAGVVWCWAPTAGLVYEAKAKTLSTVNTQAKIDALKGSAVVFDLTATTAGTYTIDAAATDAAANALVIIDGDYRAGTVQFVVKTGWSVLYSTSTLS